MSLINQMLRDLQQRKDGGGPTKSEPLRPIRAASVPYLPLPLVLCGAALGLLLFLWWMAGVLSNMMFAPELLLVAETSTEVVAEQDQLTMEERMAEAPVAPVVSEQVTEKAQTAVSEQPVQVAAVAEDPVKRQAVKKQTTAKQSPVVAKPSKQTVARRKSVAASPRVTKKTQPVKSHKIKAPRKVVAKAPKRLHPDLLPGAIKSSSHGVIATKGPSRQSVVRATTPYGKAEKAFLDGKWALEQQRNNLGVRSLQQALALYPGHLPARELLAETLENDGKTGEAMFLLAEGLEIAPDYIVFKKNYARLLVDQGDYEAATEVMLYDGLPTVEEDPEAHVVLATLYQRLDESFLAAQTYRNLLVAWPQTGAFWVGLGSALEGQNLFEEAVECYEKALKTKNLRQDLSRYAKKRLGQLK